MILPAEPTTPGLMPTTKAAGLFRPQRLLIAALVLLVAVGFYQLWAARVERTLLFAEEQLLESHITLSATLSSATAQLDLLRVSLERELGESVLRSRPPAVGWLQPVPGRSAFAGPTPAPRPGGPASNITLAAPLPSPDSERAAELAVAARQTPLFAAVRKNLVNVTWVYYYSLNKILAIYPCEPGNVYWSDALLDQEIVANAAPDRNPARGYYWSDVYADSAGKGLMCSVVNPVFDRQGRFRGIVGFDFTVDTLITYLNSA